MTVETRRVRVAEGIELTVDIHGDPSGNRSLLFVHGGGQTRGSWQASAAALAAAGWPSVNVDLRGHGESDWSPDGAYEVDDFAADLAQVCAAIGIRPVLVGASLGGLSGIVLEGRLAPGTISRLVLVDIVPRMNRSGADRVRDFMLANAASGFGSLEEVAAAVAAYNPHRPPPSDHEGLRRNLRERDGRFYWHWDPAFITRLDENGRDPNEGARDGDGLSRDCAGVSVPILLVRGRMSDLVTAEGAAAFLADHPAADFVDVSGAGHMVAGDRNDVFTAAVADWIEANPGSGRGRA